MLLKFVEKLKNYIEKKEEYKYRTRTKETTITLNLVKFLLNLNIYKARRSSLFVV